MAMVDQIPETSDAPLLEYGRRSRLGWVGRHRWKAFLLALVVFAAGLAVHYRHSLRHRVLWIYWSHRAANFEMPKSVTLIVDSDPAQVRALLASNPDYVPASNKFGTFAVYSPLVYRRLKEFDPRCDLTSGRLEANVDGIAFLGSLRRPDGVMRMVIVKGPYFSAGSLISSEAVLIMPMPGIGDSLPQAVPPNGAIFGRSSHDIPAEVSNGVVDPADPSHLTFKYTVRSTFTTSANPHHYLIVQGTVHAHLQNDDTLRLALGPQSISGDDPHGTVARYLLREIRVAPQIVVDLRKRELDRIKSDQLSKSFRAAMLVQQNPSTAPNPGAGP